MALSFPSSSSTPALSSFLPRRPVFVSTINPSDDPPATIYRSNPHLDPGESQRIDNAINALFVEMEEGKGDSDLAGPPRESRGLDKKNTLAAANAASGREEDELSAGEIYEGPPVRNTVEADAKRSGSKTERKSAPSLFPWGLYIEHQVRFRNSERPQSKHFHTYHRKGDSLPSQAAPCSSSEAERRRTPADSRTVP